MTAIDQRKPALSRKSLAWQALFVITLVLIGRFLWTHNRPEFLTPAPTGTYLVSGEHLYILALPQGRGAKEYTVQVQSIRDAARRVLCTEDAGWQFYQSDQSYEANSLSVVDGNLYYGVEQPPKLVSSGGGRSNSLVSSGGGRSNSLVSSGGGRSNSLVSSGGGRSNSTDAITYLGTFLLQASNLSGAERAGQKPAHSPSNPAYFVAPLRKEVRFRQISLQNGTAHNVATLRGTDFCLIGDHVVWIQPATEEEAIVQRRQPHRNQVYWRETSAHGDLMLTSLADGTTRCIYHGIPSFTFLKGGKTGVSWEQPAPFPHGPTRFYARASDGSVHSLGPVTEAINMGTCLEWGGRLYWQAIHSERTGSSGSPISRNVLMSARMDGTDVRELLTQADNHNIANLQFLVSRGSVYVCLTLTPLATEKSDKSNLLLCRLHPDRSDPIEILRKLPVMSGDYKVDDGYFYFTLRKEKRSLWATLTNDDMFDGYTSTLCRIPLNP